jgi:hypothetical protein
VGAGAETAPVVVAVVVFTTVVLLVLEWAGRDRKMPLKKNMDLIQYLVEEIE